MNDLESRLAALGDALVLDDGDLVDDVLARLDGPPAARPTGSRPLRLAAAIVLVLALVAVAIPDARRTVAEWLGLDGVRVERRPDLVIDQTVPPPSEAAAAAPGESRVMTVEGRSVIVSTIDGTLDDGLLTKTVGASTTVTEVEVGGSRGLWIAGEPHEVVYVAGDGEVVVERVAADTLLWQHGDLIHRVEGFDQLAEAVDFADDFGT